MAAAAVAAAAAYGDVVARWYVVAVAGATSAGRAPATGASGEVAMPVAAIKAAEAAVGEA
jgi:hypothetical protein